MADHFVLVYLSLIDLGSGLSLFVAMILGTRTSFRSLDLEGRTQLALGQMDSDSLKVVAASSVAIFDPPVPRSS